MNMNTVLSYTDTCLLIEHCLPWKGELPVHMQPRPLPEVVCKLFRTLEGRFSLSIIVPRRATKLNYWSRLCEGLLGDSSFTDGHQLITHVNTLHIRILHINSHYTCVQA
ncbi:hypothetical protein GDO78_012423 [Eleutherodactylus coqui]|uniref:Uncharacterized protein n=1 Tax=Eleutherodactylus coqui TaxID=57060 RepID=A0A8J6F229_ELECQ|nr:hypothetical protein GDO78_012423 [Eleutherodactylus coqui]